MRPITRNSTHVPSGFVAVYYVLTIALGAFVLLFHGKLAFAVDLIVIVFYLAMTAFFYDFSKRVAHRHTPAQRNY